MEQNHGDLQITKSIIKPHPVVHHRPHPRGRRTPTQTRTDHPQPCTSHNGILSRTARGAQERHDRAANVPRGCHTIRATLTAAGAHTRAAPACMHTGRNETRPHTLARTGLERCDATAGSRSGTDEYTRQHALRLLWPPGEHGHALRPAEGAPPPTQGSQPEDRSVNQFTHTGPYRHCMAEQPGTPKQSNGRPPRVNH